MAFSKASANSVSCDTSLAGVVGL